MPMKRGKGAPKVNKIVSRLSTDSRNRMERKRKEVL